MKTARLLLALLFTSFLTPANPAHAGFISIVQSAELVASFDPEGIRLTGKYILKNAGTEPVNDARGIFYFGTWQWSSPSVRIERDFTATSEVNVLIPKSAFECPDSDKKPLDIPIWSPCPWQGVPERGSIPIVIFNYYRDSGRRLFSSPVVAVMPLPHQSSEPPPAPPFVLSTSVRPSANGFEIRAEVRNTSRKTREYSLSAIVPQELQVYDPVRTSKVGPDTTQTTVFTGRMLNVVPNSRYVAYVLVQWDDNGRHDAIPGVTTIVVPAVEESDHSLPYTGLGVCAAIFLLSAISLFLRRKSSTK